MTKRLAIFALMLMAVVGMQAQSLMGSWKDVTNEDEKEVGVYYIFNQSTFIFKSVVTQSDPEVGTIAISVTVPGTYTLSGNALNIKINPEQADVHIDKMEFTDEIKKLLNEMPEMKKTITETMEKTFNEEKAELVKSHAVEGDMVIESLTATQLILVEDDEKMIFTRDVSSDDTNVYERPDMMPEYPGGTNEMMQYLAKNLKYPEVCEENGIQGRVVVSFVIEKDGSVVDVNIIKSVNPALDKEAKRLVNSMPKWSPGKIDGKPVRVRYSVPITFRL